MKKIVHNCDLNSYASILPTYFQISIFKLQANLGFMESRKDKINVALSNMALIQCQAIAVSSLAVIPVLFLGEQAVYPSCQFKVSTMNFRYHSTILYACCYQQL